MAFNADVYLAASKDRIEEGNKLYRSECYVLTHYIAGVAVECLLRAYRFRRNPEFDARHDLYKLFHSSGIILALKSKEVYAANSSLAAVSFRWANDFRYRSEPDLRRYLKAIGADRGIKGDVLKENARRSIKAASELVAIGVRAWRRS